MNPMILEIIGSFVRWVLTIVGGWLVTKGVWTQEQADQYITFLTAGIALSLCTLAWSLWKQYKSRRLQVTAQAMPAHQTERDVKAVVASGQAPSVFTAADAVPKLKGNS